MTTRTSPWPAGVPCWADLMTPDVPASRAFYSAVLGWTYDELERGYAVAKVRGESAAGIGPGKRAAWTPYLATDDVDAASTAVTDAGGSLLQEPRDVGELGRLLVAADPTGAVFGLWQHGTSIGADVVNEPGALVWEDLRSSDPATAISFYTRLFGYVHEPFPGAPQGYGTFRLPDEQAPLGGMGGIMAGPPGTPSHWVVYWSVTDVDAAVAAATAGGGAVLAGPFDTPFGRQALLADPHGAAFCLIAIPDGAPVPDRAG